MVTRLAGKWLMLLRLIGMVLLFGLWFMVWPLNKAWAEEAEATLRYRDPGELYAQLSAGQRVNLFPDRMYPVPEQPTVYLTFDDGPSQWTPKVLELLREEGVPATFFVLGEQAEKYPEAIRAIAADGHGLGNHTYNHRYEELYRGFDGFWEQIQRTEGILRDILGRAPALIRAPGGTYSYFDAFYFYYLELAGYTVFDWNVDSGDAKRRGVPAAEIIQNIKSAPLRHEMIVLLHDGAGHEETVKALPDIIAYFKQNGYQFAVLTEAVRPVQFRLAEQLKWPRPVSPEQFAQQMSLLTQWQRERELAMSSNRPIPANEATEEAGWQAALTKLADGKPGGILLQAASSWAKSAADVRMAGETGRDGPGLSPTSSATYLPLLWQSHWSRIPPTPLMLGTGAWLVGEWNRQEQDQMLIPVRLWAEQLGGVVDWHASDMTASIRFDRKHLVIDPKGKLIRETRPDGRTVLHVAEGMSLKAGTLYLPINTVLSLMARAV